MRTNFVIPAEDDIYQSPVFNVTTLDSITTNMITLEFYDDEELTEVSVGVTGTITIDGKMSTNSIWQNIPNSASPSTINCATPYSIGFNGVVNQLQIETDTLANTNFVNVIFDVTKST